MEERTAVPSVTPQPRDRTRDGILKRCPRLVAHMICESLGYATPSLAAKIVADGADGRENWCEWIYSCYRRNARRALQDAIRQRHGHRGYMSDFRLALALVREAAQSGREPELASWF